MRAVGINDVGGYVKRRITTLQSQLGMVGARAVVQGSGCGSSSSLGSRLVGAHGSVGSRFGGGVLQDSSSDDEAARPKPAKVPGGNKEVAPAPVGIVCESNSD